MFKFLARFCLLILTSATAVVALLPLSLDSARNPATLKTRKILDRETSRGSFGSRIHKDPFHRIHSINGVVEDTAPESQTADATNRPRESYDSIVCGGGPAGLLTAIMLSRKYGPSHSIAVCERLPRIPPSPSDEAVWSDVARFYLLGIGFRGQRALEKFGVLDDFKKASVEVQGRRDWQPGMTRPEDGKITPAKKAVASRVLARDKLVGVLYHHVVKNYVQDQDSQIDLLYGYEVEPVSFGEGQSGGSEEDSVRVRITKCQEVVTASSDANSEDEEVCSVDESFVQVESTTKLLIGADGAARKVANTMEQFDSEKMSKMNPLRRLVAKKPFKVTRFEDDNQRLFKSVPIQLPSDWPTGLNYSARSRNNRITLEALPSDDKGSLCALLLLKPDDEFAKPDVDPSKLRKFFDEEFPQFGALIDDEEMARVAKKPATALPAFRYAGPRLNYGKRTLVLGDAAHTVKPYYGLGCNTALEDVEILSDTLDECIENQENAESSEDPIQRAVPLFSQRRAADSKALVTISRNMDRGGKMFLVCFLLPLILDGIFHKLAPKIFGPNMFVMFRRQDLRFTQIQRKKRIDRALQATVLGSVLTGVALAAKFAVARLARALGTDSKVVSSALLAIGLVTGAVRKAGGSSKAKEAS